MFRCPPSVGTTGIQEFLALFLVRYAFATSMVGGIFLPSFLHLRPCNSRFRSDMDLRRRRWAVQERGVLGESLRKQRLGRAVPACIGRQTALVAPAGSLMHYLRTARDCYLGSPRLP